MKNSPNVCGTGDSISILSLLQYRRHEGVLMGLVPQNKSPITPKLE